MGILLAGMALVVQESIDPLRAARYFAEAKLASDDLAEVWGRPLYGPTIFVDRTTRFAVANQADGEGKLARRGDVWVGQVPRDLGLANTATTWSGVKWSMVLWPMSANLAVRNSLLMHESWHRIQDELGLPAEGPPNAHLDTKDGRSWLRLEWRALSRALISWGPERRESLTDALTFRRYRHTLFPRAASEEDRMELHEGLAEYTGIRALGLDDWGTRSFLSGRLKASAQKPSYSYAFAYENGPAYGLLLDMDAAGWRRQLTPRSRLSEMLMTATGIKLPREIAAVAKRRAGAYAGREVLREEEARERDRLTRTAAYRRRLITGPILELPMRAVQMTFNPDEVMPLGAEGTVYPTITLNGAWGTLEVTHGALINGAFSAIAVPAPSAADRLSGDGWNLILKPGWQIVPGPRKGDWKVAASP